MRLLPTAIKDVIIIEPKVFGDHRGYFLQTYEAQAYAQYGIHAQFVQDNLSFSSQGVLRGLHLQRGPHAQAKLVSVAQGKVLDVAVDLRQDSPSFGQHVAVVLSSENHRQLFIPRGFAHGFIVLSETAIFTYKCDNYYHKESEAGLRFDDPDLNIDWGPDLDKVQVSDKDLALPNLKDWRHD